MRIKLRKLVLVVSGSLVVLGLAASSALAQTSPGRVHSGSPTGPTYAGGVNIAAVPFDANDVFSTLPPGSTAVFAMHSPAGWDGYCDEGSATATVGSAVAPQPFTINTLTLFGGSGVIPDGGGSELCVQNLPGADTTSISISLPVDGEVLQGSDSASDSNANGTLRPFDDIVLTIAMFDIAANPVPSNNPTGQQAKCVYRATPANGAVFAYHAANPTPETGASDVVTVRATGSQDVATNFTLCPDSMDYYIHGRARGSSGQQLFVGP